MASQISHVDTTFIIAAFGLHGVVCKVLCAKAGSTHLCNQEIPLSNSFNVFSSSLAITYYREKSSVLWAGKMVVVIDI